MFKRRMSLVLVAVAVPLFGGVAYAATQSVSSEPSPRTVIPASPRTDDHRGVRDSGHGSDDAVTHDLNDDQGGLATTTTAPTGDDPATHDVGDDHGGTTATTSDDPASHDVGDDNGGTTTATTGDASSGSNGPGSSSVSGSGGGTDDPATHDVGDDHGGK